MNAQTSIEPWEAYRPALEILMPGCGEDEARYRCGLMAARDQAQIYIDQDTTGFMQTIWLNAGEAATARMSTNDLQHCWRAVCRMFLAARHLMTISDRVAGGNGARD